MSETVEQGRYDLVIIGGTAGGLSVAISSARSGIENVRIIESGTTVAFPELVGENQLDIGYGENVVSVDRDGDDLVVTTDHHLYRTTGVLVAQREPDPDWVPPFPVPDNKRVLVDTLPDHIDDTDIMVIGMSDNAVELVANAAHRGGRVVHAAGGMDPGRLSPAGENMLRRLERERRATILYRSVPNQIGEIRNPQGSRFPIAYFSDRRTPDLEFDHIVFATTRRRPESVRASVSDAAMATGKVIFLGVPEKDPAVPTASGWEVGNVVAAAVFPDLDVAPARSKLLQRAQSGAI